MLFSHFAGGMRALSYSFSCLSRLSIQKVNKFTQLPGLTFNEKR